MARHMTARSWRILLKGIQNLKTFVKKKNSDYRKLSDFRIQCLMGDDQEWYDKNYDSLVQHPNRQSSKDKMGDFKEYMRKKMTNNEWRLLIHWILDWEASLIYLNPQPEKPWPMPLYDKDLFVLFPDDKYSQEDMILDLLENTELNHPKPGSWGQKCKSDNQ